MEVTTVKKGRELTREGLDKLLARLDEDRERAGEQYEGLHARLTRLFEWRGSSAPEEHADETLNRVARKLEEGEDVRDVHAFAGGVARLVWLEAVKQERRARAALEQMPPRREVDEKTTRGSRALGLAWVNSRTTAARSSSNTTARRRARRSRRGESSPRVWGFHTARCDCASAACGGNWRSASAAV